MKEAFNRWCEHWCACMNVLTTYFCHLLLNQSLNPWNQRSMKRLKHWWPWH